MSTRIRVYRRLTRLRVMADMTMRLRRLRAPSWTESNRSVTRVLVQEGLASGSRVLTFR